MERGNSQGSAGPASAYWLGKLRLAFIALAVIGLFMIARRLPVEAMLNGLSGWIEGLGPWGPLVFGLLYVVAVVLMIPGSALTLAGGAIFGLVTGTITVSIASNVGAALAFLIARYLARDAVARRAQGNAKFAAIDRAIGDGGWKIVALLRLSPALPFNLQNYLYGLTRIGFWPCVLASWVAMLPGTLLYVYLGYVGRAGLEAAAGSGPSRTPAEWAMIAVGLTATLAVTVYVTMLAKRALQQRDELAELPKEEPAEEAQPRPEAKPALAPKQLIGTAVLGLVALVISGTAFAMEFKPNWIRSAASLFGAPPAAELKEVYENKTGGPNFDHSQIDALLRRHVRAGGWVDYQGLKQDEAELDSYLDQVAEAPFDDMGRDQKLALLINAYNAFTLKLILEHYPVDSIKSIPDSERWDAARWQVGSHTWSLNQIEHEEIRPKFREPRIHFALVCAAVGCPPLRNEAYVADRLEEQLEDQARYVHEHPRWVQWDGGDQIGLTSLYDWYGGDFEQVAGSVLAYAAEYLPELKERLEAGQAPRITWLDYDWSLNTIENRPEDAQ